MDFDLLVILSCLLVAGTAHDCYELDTDYPGNDINKDTIIRESAEVCQALCSHTEKCNYFTWVPSEKHCWLKTDGGPAKALNYDERHAISGPRVCEKKSSAGPPNNFLNAFNAQWTCNEKYELLNEYEMTSLIFKETLQIFINMTEGKEFSECYTNDVTSSTSNGPQVMYLYTNENENDMCNNTQHILTTFNTESSSNYVSCLLHHPTKITSTASTTSTAFVATALCANIYEEIDPAPVITSVTCLGNSTPTKDCPSGWTTLPTGCYKLTNPGTHQQATEDCKKDGGYLVEIDSQEENYALVPYYNVYTWLGATDIDKEGKWVWSQSGRQLNFTNWQNGEPNGKTRENCLRFTLYHNGKWNDADCEEKRKGVCELSTEI